MSDLKPCPCGQTPLSTAVQGGNYGNRADKWCWVSGTCCGEWHVEFRSGHTSDINELRSLAEDAWNAAPRADEGGGDDDLG